MCFGVDHTSRANFQVNATTKYTNSKKRIKIMVANSEMKYKFKVILGVIRGIVFDFLLYFVIV